MFVFSCLLLQIIAFYLFYQCSARIKIKRGRLGNWLLQHKKNTKALAGTLLLVSALVLIRSFSIATSVLVALASVMTVFSVLIIAIPLFQKE